MINIKEIKILYHDKDMPKLEQIGGSAKSAMIDLYVAQDYEIEVGKFYLLSLGVSMKLPDGYEAEIIPRSSTFKKYGILQANSQGLIDNSYSGSGDIWHMPIFIPFFQDDIKQSFIQFLDGMMSEVNVSETFGKYETAEQFVDKKLNFRKVKIEKGTRLCQFKINKTMEDIEFVESELDDVNRGGFGQGTGK